MMLSTRSEPIKFERNRDAPKARWCAIGFGFVWVRLGLLRTQFTDVLCELSCLASFAVR